MHLADLIAILFIDQRLYIIGIFHCVRVLFNSAVPAVKISLQRFQVIGVHCGKHIRHHLHYMNISLLILCAASFVAYHNRRKIKACALNLKGVFRECLFLYLMNIVIHSGRQ